MHVFTFFLKVGFHWIFPRDLQWDFTRRDDPGNPRRASGWGLVTNPCGVFIIQIMGMRLSCV